MRVTGVFLALLVAGAASAREFTIYRVIGKRASQVDAALGKPLSIGQDGAFREYGTPRSSWYVKFNKGIAVSATVTFRKAFPTPAQAMNAIGIVVGKAKPAKTNILMQLWLNLGGLRSVEVQSTDGKLWETIEIVK